MSCGGRLPRHWLVGAGQEGGQSQEPKLEHFHSLTVSQKIRGDRGGRGVGGIYFLVTGYGPGRCLAHVVLLLMGWRYFLSHSIVRQRQVILYKLESEIFGGGLCSPTCESKDDSWMGRAGGRYAENIMTSQMDPARRVAVYCGSADGNDPAFRAEATALGVALATAGPGLGYGGSVVGLMGAVADAALAGGAEVIGVLPEVLAGNEIAHPRLIRLELVDTMHQRKARMVELADAILVLPGGYGTLEEVLEAVTWAQLSLHAKPCILINTAGYWDGLLAFLDTAVEAGFLKPKNRELMRVAADAEEAVGMLVAAPR